MLEDVEDQCAGDAEVRVVQLVWWETSVHVELRDETETAVRVQMHRVLHAQLCLASQIATLAASFQGAILRPQALKLRDRARRRRRTVGELCIAEVCLRDQALVARPL